MTRTLGQTPVGADQLQSTSFTPDEILAQRDIVRELGYNFNDETFLQGMFAKLKINGAEKLVNTKKQSHFQKRSIFNTATVATVTAGATTVAITYTAASVTGVTPDPTSVGNVKEIVAAASTPIRGRITAKSSASVTTTITVTPQNGTSAAAFAAAYPIGTVISFFGSSEAEGDAFGDGYFQLFDRYDLVFQKISEATPFMTNEFIGSAWRILVSGSEYPLRQEMLDTMMRMEIKKGIATIYGKGTGFGSGNLNPETMGLHTIGLNYGGSVSYGGTFDATDEANIGLYMDANQMGSQVDFHTARNLGIAVQTYLTSLGANFVRFNTDLGTKDRHINFPSASWTSATNKSFNLYALPEATHPYITDMGQVSTGYYSNTGVVIPTQGTGAGVFNPDLGTYGQISVQPLDFEILCFGQEEDIRNPGNRLKVASAYQTPAINNAWEHKMVYATDFAFRAKAVNKVLSVIY
jgi:hypothetical protein